MDLREHISHAFEAELRAVKEKLLDMGRQVDEVVAAAGRALVGRDVALANSIILGDQDTDGMELEIDNFCLEILARRQPVAGDLRLLTSALKIVIDLERVGDLGVNIASRVVDLGSDPPVMPYEDLIVLLTASRAMVADGLAALVEGDVARAEHVIGRDPIVDAMATRVFDDLVRRMRADPSNVSRATRVQAITRYAERIGDHGTNIAERAIFVLTGEEIRHRPRAPLAPLC
jgi:phosphate transport system protein